MSLFIDDEDLFDEYPEEWDDDFDIAEFEEPYDEFEELYDEFEPGFYRNED